MSDSNEYDVAVLGGGLAGLASSILLAMSGRSVVLVEKKSYPFHRVCGEYLSMESWPFLESLGLNLKGMDLPRIHRLRITDAKGAEVEEKLDKGAFGISRFALDEMLAKRAKQLGVDVWENVRANVIDFTENGHQVETSRGSINAKVVIGAFGKRSNLDKELKRNFIQQAQPAIRNYVGIKYHVKADFPEDLIELHIFPDGYCGISRIEEPGTCCMCYLTTAENLQKAGGDIGEMEKQILHQNKNLKHYFDTYPKAWDKPLSISQVYFSAKSQVEDHVLMAGDAAGLIAPLSGNGMSMALRGANMVSGLIDDFLDNKTSRTEMEHQYKTQWERAFKTRLLAGRLLQHTFFGEASVHAFLKVMEHTPILRKKLIGLTHGEDF